MKLLPSQKKEVFEIIQMHNAALLPRFYWGQRESDYTRNQVDVLYVRDSEFYFCFDSNSAGGNVDIYSPGESSFVKAVGPTGWSSTINRIILWLNYLTREFNAGDPWGDLAKAISQSDLQLDENVEATKFTFSEYAQVVKTLDVIKGLLITYSNSDAATLTRIEKEIGSLKEAAKEQDRKTIFYQIVGFIASTTVSMLLAPEQTRALYEALKAGFAKFVILIGN